MFPCTPLVYSLGALCSFFIYILLFTDKKKKSILAILLHALLLGTSNKIDHCLKTK